MSSRNRISRLITGLILILAPCISFSQTPVSKEEDALAFKHYCKTLGEGLEGPLGLNQLTNWPRNSYQNGNFAEVEKYATYWSRPGCSMTDGRSRLTALEDALSAVAYSPKDWSLPPYQAKQYRKAFPKSPVPVVAEALYWLYYGWEARGTGYADTISKDGYRLFQQRLHNAEKVLLEAKSYAAESPLWYSTMINVLRGLDDPSVDPVQVFEEGISRYPWYFPIYFQMTSSLLPWWSGSWEVIDQLAELSVKNTSKDQGNSLYARIYWNLNGLIYGRPLTLFKDTKAKWPKMKQGFQDLLRLTPNSLWNRVNYLAFACVAGDRDTFIQVRKSFADEVVVALWPQITSLDVCEQKFGFKRK